MKFTHEDFLAQRPKQVAMDALRGESPSCGVPVPSGRYATWRWICTRPKGHAGMHVGANTLRGSVHDADFRSEGIACVAWDEGTAPLELWVPGEAS